METVSGVGAGRAGRPGDARCCATCLRESVPAGVCLNVSLLTYSRRVTGEQQTHLGGGEQAGLRNRQSRENPAWFSEGKTVGVLHHSHGENPGG